MDGPDRADAWLRLAGAEPLVDGSLRTWSVAEGRRGRRWRETRFDRERGLVSTMVLETASGETFARLEMTTAQGMLTLHPAADGRSVHGNAIGPTGVRHLALPWDPGRRLLVLGSPLSARMLVAGSAAAAGSAAVPVLVVADELDPREALASVVRARGGWSISVAGAVVDVDGPSVPAIPFAGVGAVWPLERP